MSKTVKRVSKTAKRVMTATMIGLVAMLGAKAEAHTRWFNGKPRVCSICSDKEDNLLEEVLNDPNLANSRAIAELTVKTKLVTISCDNTEVQLKNEWTLKNEAPLVWDEKSKTAHVVFFISDQPFVDFVMDRRLCIEPPKVVLIRRMDAVYRAYECFGPSDRDPCSSKVLVSRMKLNDCKVPPNAGFDTFYDCKKPKREHVL